MLDETQFQYIPKYVPRVRHTLGAAPGVEHDEIAALPSGPERARVTCIDYSPAHVQTQEIDDLEPFLGIHRPE